MKPGNNKNQKPEFGANSFTFHRKFLTQVEFLIPLKQGVFRVPWDLINSKEFGIHGSMVRSFPCCYRDLCYSTDHASGKLTPHHLTSQ